MSDPSQKKTLIPKNWGFLPELALKVKLILRLMSDSRVNPIIKVLPVASVVYWILPADLIPLIPIDDAAIIWLGGAMFLELCPQDVVQEHLNDLRLEALRAESLKAAREGQSQANIEGEKPESSGGDVVDAEYRDVTGKEDRRDS
jgi:uncharacterized membrane protein YkvA (DUF1232 family)